MKEQTASHTARSVAARRLQYDRVAAPYGDPAADEALTHDVAEGLSPTHNRMHEYIRARTAFFDRIVVNSIDRGITQVVIGGAGYDGRALRYAKPGVRWFEVDHPATQTDKLARIARIARLGIATPRVRFIPADFTADPRRLDGQRAIRPAAVRGTAARPRRSARSSRPRSTRTRSSRTRSPDSASARSSCRLAGPGRPARQPPALPHDPAPRRVPRRQLRLTSIIRGRCGGDPPGGKELARRC